MLTSGQAAFLAILILSDRDDVAAYTNILVYSVKQSDRNSSKMDLFHKPTTYEQHV